MAITKVTRGLLSTGIDDNSDATAITIDSSENVAIGSSTANKKFNIADPNQGGETLKLHFEAFSSDDKWAIYSYDRTNGHVADLSFGSNYLYLKSGGNVGIGTTSPDGKTDIAQDQNTTAASFTTPHLALTATGVTNTTGFTGISYATSTLTNYGWTAGAQRTSTSGGTNAFIFRNHSNSAAGTERMRIGSAGGVAIGTSTIGTPQGLTIDGSSASDRLLKIQDSDSSVDASNIMMVLDFSNDDNCDNAKYIGFEDSNGLIGSVSVNGAAAVSYNTSSDYRLKENVSYDWDATTRLKQLRPARFNWISDPTDTLIDGFLAHEVSDIVPEAITGEKDATETITNAVLNANGKVIAKGISEDDWTAGKADAVLWAEEDELPEGISVGDVKTKATYPSNSTWEASHEANLYQGIDQAKLVPLLVKTIQELEARITTLENA